MEPLDVRLSRGGGYWRAWWFDADGVRRFKSLGAVDKTTKTEARRRAALLAQEMTLQPWSRTPRQGPTLAAWADQYIKLRSGDLRPRVVSMHRTTLAYLSEHLGPNTSTSAITRQDAAEWRAWLGSKEMTDATVCRHVRTARVVFSTLKSLGLIPENPFAGLRGTPAPVAKTWVNIDDAAMVKIMDQASTQGHRCLFALCRYAGLRRGEGLRLAWDDIDWTGRVMRILPEMDEKGSRRRTTKQRVRTVPISGRLYAVLRETQDGAPDGSTGPCSDVPTANIDRNARATIKRALGDLYTKPFHTLRKCCLSEWATLVMPPTLSEWSGDRIETLMEHYVRVQAADLAKVTGQPVSDLCHSPVQKP